MLLILALVLILFSPRASVPIVLRIKCQDSKNESRVSHHVINQLEVTGCCWAKGQSLGAVTTLKRQDTVTSLTRAQEYGRSNQCSLQ